MAALSGPWADLALFLRQTVTQSDRETDSFLPLWFFGLLLFLPVCLLLLQLIVYLSWKLGEVEDELSKLQDRSDNHREMYRLANMRMRRAGSPSYSQQDTRT